MDKKSSVALFYIAWVTGESFFRPSVKVKNKSEISNEYEQLHIPRY